MRNTLESLLSIVVPISNPDERHKELGEWINECLDNGIQVILVHDTNSFESNPFIESLINRINDSNFSQISGNFGSPGAARNAGRLLARNKWMSFWDSDDTPKVSEFCKMVKLANAKNVDACIGGYAEFSINTNKIVKCHYPEKTLDIAIDPGLWRIAFRKNLIGSINFTSNLMGEDQIFMIDFFKTQRNCLFFNSIVYKYNTGHPRQLTNANGNYIELEKFCKHLGNNFVPRNDFYSLVYLKALMSLLIRSKRKMRINLIGEIFILLLVKRTIKASSVLKILFRIIPNRHTK